jgi:hypothetical protein
LIVTTALDDGATVYAGAESATADAPDAPDAPDAGELLFEVSSPQPDSVAVTINIPRNRPSSPASAPILIVRLACRLIPEALGLSSDLQPVCAFNSEASEHW